MDADAAAPAATRHRSHRDGEPEPGAAVRETPRPTASPASPDTCDQGGGLDFQTLCAVWEPTPRGWQATRVTGPRKRHNSAAQRREISRTATVIRTSAHTRPSSSVMSTSHTHVVRPRWRRRAVAWIVPPRIGRRKLVWLDSPWALPALGRDRHPGRGRGDATRRSRRRRRRGRGPPGCLMLVGDLDLGADRPRRRRLDRPRGRRARRTSWSRASRGSMSAM